MEQQTEKAESGLLAQFPFTNATILENQSNEDLIRIQDIKLIPFFKTSYFKKNAVQVTESIQSLEATPRQIGEWLVKVNLTPCNIVTLEQIYGMKKKELKEFGWITPTSRNIIFLGTTLVKNIPESDNGKIVCPHLCLDMVLKKTYPGIIDFDDHIDVRTYLAVYKP